MLRAIALTLCLFSAGACAAPAGFQLGDDSAGPTCANYTSSGTLAWSQPGGDWADAAGQLYGDKAFSTLLVTQSKTRQILDMDLTDLVRGWVEKRYPNDGMLLRVLPGKLKGVVDLHSRESPDLGGRPMLKLEWADGSRDRLSPAADTYLDCSSVSSLGTQPTLKLSRSQSALLRFNLPRHEGALKAATLYLASDQQYAGGAEIGSFRVSPPYRRVSEAPRQGLAAGAPNDQGLAGKPDVVFATGFEAARWAGEWSEQGPASAADTVSEDFAEHFAPLSGKALRVRIPKGRNLGLDLRYLFAQKGLPEPEEIHFRYYLRLGHNWAPTVDGGKLPGVAGTYGQAGWGMRKADGYNGWSARGGFGRWPKGSSAPYTGIGSYLYHADQKETSGDYLAWSLGPGGLLENDRWYAIEQYVKLNTPGRDDGILRAWIDGNLVLERTNIRYRHAPKLKIESIWLDVYHGGTATAPQDMVLFIDNVVIARSYIGPMRQ